MKTTSRQRRSDRSAERAQRLADREQRRERKRELMLAAAIGLVRKQGPGVSMDEIARAAGVTKPIVYRAFGDREGLIDAIAHRFADELAQTLTAEVSTPDRNAREAVSGTIDAYLAFIERDPAIVRFLIQRGLTEDGDIALTGFVRSIASLITRALGEQLRALGLDTGAAEPWAYAIVGAVHLAGDWWLERRTLPRARLVEYLTQLVWDGMKDFRTTGEEAT